MWIRPTEGHDTVPLSSSRLGIPRLARAVAVIGLASAPAVLLSLPASASTGAPAAQRDWWINALHVTQAWRTTDGSGITVAVLADGVDASQADVAGHVIEGPDFTRSGRHQGGPYFGIVGTGLASLIAGHGHGKTSSGQASAGVHGVAGGTRILSVRVTLSPRDPLWSNSGITSRLPDAIAAGIRYAVKHRATIIDLPPDPGLPGFPGWGDVAAAAGGSGAERGAISYALSKGVLLVAPAGDNAQSGDAVNYPAAYPGVISVGAFGRNFVKAPYSSHQDYVTLTAAGEDVVAASPSGYQTMNSTWAASAVVTGIAALIRAQFPSLSVTQVSNSMTGSTAFHRAGGRLNGSGYGTVDALSAVKDAATMSPPHAEPATQGALPKARPAPPAVASEQTVITKELIRDGEISAAAFLVLLLPIMAYSTTARRRERHGALVAAERERENRTRPGQATMLADPLLEFFGPQHAGERPIAQRPAVSPPRYQPRPSLSGRSVLSARPAIPGQLPTAALPAPVSLDDVQAGPVAPPDGHSGNGYAAEIEPIATQMPSPAAGDGITWSPTRSAPSSPVAHSPVTGTPPWEPAPEPTSALPWAVIPVPSGGTAPRAAFSQPIRQAPPESLWGDQVTHDAEVVPDDTGSHPIYVWNPPGSAGTFPSAEDDEA
jgi:hypothetical protein